MREITCPHCQKSFTEADAAWDEATATGVCPAPRCGKLLDPAAELGAEAMAAADDGVKRRARARRLKELIAGLLAVLAALYYESLLLGVAGVLGLAFAVFYSARDEARDLYKARTDLTPLSSDTRDESR